MDCLVVVARRGEVEEVGGWNCGVGVGAGVGAGNGTGAYSRSAEEVDELD